MGCATSRLLYRLDIVHQLWTLLLKKLAVAIVVGKGNAIAVHHIVIEELR